MKVSKFKVLLYLKKSNLDKQGKAPIMGRITLNNSMALVCKLEKYMMQLVQIMSKVTELTNEYKERVNSKKIEDKSNFSTQYH